MKGGGSTEKDKFYVMLSGEKPRSADVYIYGDIVSDSYDLWGQKVTSETSASTFIAELDALGEIDEINVFINSFGGFCHEGNAIANILRRQSAKTIAHIDAYAASAASVIACACKEVRMPRNTVMMIHHAWLPYASGNSAQLRKIADDLDVQNEAFKTIYLEKAGGKLSPEKLDELLDAESYLTAEQCHEYGLCDVVEDYSVAINEPSDVEKAAALKNQIDVGKICAIMRKPQSGPNPEEVVPESGAEEGKGNNFGEKAAEMFLNLFSKGV